MVATNPTETRIASVFKDERGVIVISMKDCGMIDEYDVLDLNLVIRQKCDKNSCLKLLLATGNWDMDKKAKLIAQREDALSQTRARAIVVSNKFKASLYNFLKQFNSKEYPQQFFTDKEMAYSWLIALDPKS